MPALKEFALDYALNGMPVFPLHTIVNAACSCGKGNCQSAGKHPRSPKGFKDATTDPEIIARWWMEYPDSNIGLVTGKISGLVVLDIDPRNGGIESFHKLQMEHGPMVATVTQLTGGGGTHLFFEYPAGMTVRSRANFLPGIDIKADGGYVVVAPSKHLSGKEYAWKTQE